MSETKTEKKVKGGIEIDTERCKSCELCVEACPNNLIRIDRDTINSKSYQVAVFEDPEGECHLCRFCALVCPDVAIKVVKYD